MTKQTANLFFIYFYLLLRGDLARNDFHEDPQAYTTDVELHITYMSKPLHNIQWTNKMSIGYFLVHWSTGILDYPLDFKMSI